MACSTGEGSRGCLPRHPEAQASEAPETIASLATGTVQVDPRFARVVHQANCFQSIFGSQTSLDFIISSQVTGLPV